MLHRLTWLFIGFVLFEGALRKWFLPQFSNEIFLAKDLLLLMMFLAYLQARNKNLPPLADVLLWCAWAFVAVAYAVMGASAMAVIGLRYYLAPLPLVVLVPALLREPADLERAATWGTRVALPIGILAIVQYFSPVDSALNIYARGEDDAVTGFGVEDQDLFSGLLRARVTATFSYISTFAAFLVAAWALAWISVLEGRTKADRYFAAVVLVVLAFNMAMNGSRSLFFAAVLTGLPFALIAIRRAGALKIQLLAGGLALAALYVGVAFFEPFALTAMRGGPEETAERLWAQLVLPLTVIAEVGFLGAGIGSTFGGFEDLGLQASSVAFDDVNLDRVGVEMGALGYLFCIGLKIYLLLKSFRVLARAPAGSLRLWALAAFLAQIAWGWQIPFHNSVAAIIYMAAVGLVYWIEREEKKMRLARVRRPLRSDSWHAKLPSLPR